MNSIYSLYRLIAISLGITLYLVPDLALLGAKNATPEEIEKISKAIPERISSQKKYKVLVFSKAFTYYHSSIAVAKEMAKQMGEKTGLFSADFTDDPRDLSADNLKNYDAVYLNNSTSIERGLTTEKMRTEFLEFVRNGGGLVAIHAATDGGWPGYTEMIGGNFDGHPWGHKGTYCICNEDQNHSVVKGIFDGNRSFKINDELYQYKDFEREKVRVLLSVDMSKFENHRGGRKREDNDYAMAWVKEYGKGRIFVSSPGHNHHIYWHKDILKMWYQGFRFVLREIDAKTESIPKPSFALPPTEGTQDPSVSFKTPAESQESFKVQPGYSLELVADNPMVTEPTVCVWDGNGRMYVAEWRTYMQDINGTGTNDPVSQVVRLEDKNGDGVMDHKTVFAKDLLLPRMILPLLDSVLIGESNTNDIYEYFDRDNDGVAEERKIWFAGGKRGGNVEHQPSGLIWSMDNWLYMTYSDYRLRYTDGTVLKGETKGNRGQWGLTQDNAGKVMYVDAGAGIGPAHPLFPNIYTKWHPKWVMAEGFREVFPIDGIADSQGGFGSMRPDNTAKSFTATCGQSIFRGDRLPQELIGNLFFHEPVGRLTRRATIQTDEMGRRVLHNAYDQEEFIASMDANFRPVNSATGPDGTLYIVDMHRGVVQESAWVPEGSFIHKAIKHYGLDKNVQRGRIYRVRHQDFKPGPRPNMLNESSAELIKHLSHPNGWWRDEAQKLIILKGDRSVLPSLRKLVKSSPNPLARLHSLWTIEGLDAIDLDFLQKIYRDDDPTVRAAAIRMTEPYFHQEISTISALQPLIRDPHHDAAIQLLLSASTKVTPETRKLANSVLAENPSNTYLKEIDDELNKDYFAEVARQKELAQLEAEEVALLNAGKQHFEALCATCHAPDGTGVKTPDGKMKMAPSFVNNPTVIGSKDVLAKVALQGISGPLRGKSYMGGFMMPLKTNDDQYIASVLTYIRNSFGNKAGMIKTEEVAQAREETASMTQAYTEASLREILLNSGSEIKLWKLSASHGQKHLQFLQDKDEKTTFATKAALKVGTWIEADFPHQRNVFKLILTAKGGDYPGMLKVETSENGDSWVTVADQVKGSQVTTIQFDMVVAKKVRITSLEEKNNWWQLYKLEIIGPGMGDVDQYKPSDRHYLQLSDAKKVQVGWNTAKQNRSVTGGELKVAGKKFTHGIGTHAHSEITYDLNGKGYQRFYSMVGHNDGGQDTYLTFEVHVDDKKVFDSGDMKKGEKAKPVDISVKGANTLKLVVTNGQDGKPEGDHADWGYAFLVK
jgi:type 1 glutamine amidotransferase/mono/diheme cytochrome c family protein/glucose/arabinose dehydrogenase